MARIKRSYQQEAEDAVFDHLSEGVRKQLVVLATGLGKTFIGANIIKRMQHVMNSTKGSFRMLWITHAEELIDQSTMSVLSEYIGDEAPEHIKKAGGVVDFMKLGKGLFHNEMHMLITDTLGLVKQTQFSIDKPIVVASIQTIVNRLDLIDPKHFDLIVVDEAHMSGAPTWSKVLNYFQPELLLGLTATPYRKDGVSLSDLFDKIVFERDIKYGVDNGFLCKIDAIRVKTVSDLDRVHSQAGDLNQKELRAAVDTPERNKLIVEKYKQYASGRMAFVFCVDIGHAMNLSDAFSEAGLPATFVVSDEELCPDRKDRIELYRNGHYIVLTNVNILTTGIDVPNTSCIIMARPTKSKTLYLQAIGRGTRLKDGTCKFKDLLIIDVVDNTSKHSLINTWTLEKELPPDQRVFISDEKKEKLITERQRKMTEIDRDQKVQLLEPPKVKIYDTIRTREPATPAQLHYISTKLGYDIVNESYTIAQVQEIISSQPATREQVEYAKRHNYNVANGLTLGQFKEIENLIAKSGGIRPKNGVKNPFKGIR